MSTPEILPQLDRPQLFLSLREDLWYRAQYLPPPFLECVPTGLLSYGWTPLEGLWQSTVTSQSIPPFFLQRRS